MSNLAIQENNFTEEKDLRDKCMEEIGVLDKVKKMFLIPEIELMTMTQVADYFAVDINTIRVCYQRNREEIEPDGVVFKRSSELMAHLVLLEKKQTTKVYEISKDEKVVIPNRGINCFPKRAILRIVMLLRGQ